MNDSRSHLNWLDWLRILAALAVLLHHLTPLSIGHSAVPHAYLAVDLFFLISGFVVARRYERSLSTAQLSATRFFVARIARLAPLLVLAGIASAVEVTLRKRFGSTLSQVSGLQIGIAATASFFAIPTPSWPALGYGNWPLNPPLWSLFFELLVGVLAAPWLLRMRSRSLAGVATIAAMFLVGGASSTGSVDGGAFLSAAPLAMARIVFSFCLGVILSRHAVQPSSQGWAILPCAVGLVLLGGYPAFRGSTWGLTAVIDLLVIFVAWPVLLGLATSTMAFRIPPAPLLGELSYSIYVLHSSGMFLLREIARSRGWMVHDTVWTTTLIGLGVLVIAILGVLVWERPLRRAWRRHGTAARPDALSS